MGKEQPCEKQGSASSKERTACAKVPKSEEFGLKKRQVWLMTFVLLKGNAHGYPSGDGWAGDENDIL